MMKSFYIPVLVASALAAVKATLIAKFLGVESAGIIGGAVGGAVGGVVGGGMASKAKRES